MTDEFWRWDALDLARHQNAGPELIEIAPMTSASDSSPGAKGLEAIDKTPKVSSRARSRPLFHIR